jgi:hypothetical protein
MITVTLTRKTIPFEPAGNHEYSNLSSVSSSAKEKNYESSFNATFIQQVVVRERRIYGRKTIYQTNE